MATALGSAMEFLKNFGFFDIILPFLLVFTIVFGILEKTRIFGVEKVGDKEYPKKNINSMIAFVIAFFTVATKEITQSLQVSLPNVALVLIIIVCFMMLAGSFMSDKEFSFEKRKGWVVFLTLVMFISVVLIFLNSFGWLTPITSYVGQNTETVVIPVVLIAVIVGTIAFVVGGGPKEKSEEGK